MLGGELLNEAETNPSEGPGNLKQLVLHHEAWDESKGHSGGTVPAFLTLFIAEIFLD